MPPKSTHVYGCLLIGLYYIFALGEAAACGLFAHYVRLEILPHFAAAAAGREDPGWQAKAVFASLVVAAASLLVPSILEPGVFLLVARSASERFFRRTSAAAARACRCACVCQLAALCWSAAWLWRWRGYFARHGGGGGGGEPRLAARCSAAAACLLAFLVAAVLVGVGLPVGIAVYARSAGCRGANARPLRQEYEWEVQRTRQGHGSLYRAFVLHFALMRLGGS